MYKAKLYQVDSIGWPDKVLPLVPKEPEPPPPDYNDLIHEKAEHALRKIHENT